MAPKFVKVSGVTFAEGYPETLRLLREYSEAGEEVRFLLKREPDNPHDPNAIAVICIAVGGMLGHFPRDQAARAAPVMDSGIELVVTNYEVVYRPWEEEFKPGLNLYVDRAGD